ncbi:hypothetical protein HAX54_048524, partial [Datura stramonium]|nr:hypothetical protein [Datura stramonium]
GVDSVRDSLQKDGSLIEDFTQSWPNGISKIWSNCTSRIEDRVIKSHDDLLSEKDQRIEMRLLVETGQGMTLHVSQWVVYSLVRSGS